MPSSQFHYLPLTPAVFSLLVGVLVVVALFCAISSTSCGANRPKERPSKASIAWCVVGSIVLCLACWMP
jgi:hypothetical protein